MKVKELIERLEELPPEYVVISNDEEITEAFVRDEMYLTEGHYYEDGPVVKLV